MFIFLQFENVPIIFQCTDSNKKKRKIVMTMTIFFLPLTIEMDKMISYSFILDKHQTFQKVFARHHPSNERHYRIQTLPCISTAI